MMIDKEIIKNTIAKILLMDFGDTIPHQNLAADLGVTYGTADYTFAVSRIKNECLEQGKMLENVFKVGYRITAPDDYSNRALRQYKQGARRISRGQEILDYAPTEKMSQDGLAQYRNIKDRSAALNAHLSGAIVELRLLQKNHPLRPLPPKQD